MRTHADQFAAEVLASSLHEGAPDEDGWHTAVDEELGLSVWLRRAS
jgi:hypothetical protein